MKYASSVTLYHHCLHLRKLQKLALRPARLERTASHEQPRSSRSSICKGDGRRCKWIEVAPYEVKEWPFQGQLRWGDWINPERERASHGKA